MADWIALSDREDLAEDATTALEQGLFVMEYQSPILKPEVLLQVQTNAPEARSFAVFCDPDTGISVLHRQGSELRRHRLPGPIPQRQGVGRLSFAFDVANQSWRLGHRLLGDAVDEGLECCGALASPLNLADFQALCADAPGSLRHPSVLWFGLARQKTLPGRASWIGLNTPVETRRGPVRAGHLRPGDLIATLEDGFQPLLKATRQRFPSRGSFAPIVLRSPFFGRATDLLVAADQLVMISGASVEYLFGEDEVLMPAAALADGKVAIKDNRRAVTDAVTLDLGLPATLIADGCCLISAHAEGAILPRRALEHYETLPLLPLLGQISLRHVA